MGALAWVACASLGCAGTLAPTHLHSRQEARRCMPSSELKASQDHPADAQQAEAPPDLGAELREAPPHVRRVLRAARLPLAASNATTLVALQRLKGEISAAQAYVDCLEDSLGDLTAAVMERKRKKEHVLTLVSIGLGAAAALAAGIVELADRDTPAVPIIGISGGVGSAALGGAALMTKGPRVVLKHRDNVLRTIWRGERDGSFSGFIWRLLEMPRDASTEPKAALRAQWVALLAKLPREQQPAMERLLTGSGGPYTLDALRLRKLMLDLLETEIDLMNQDFQVLMSYVAMHMERTQPLQPSSLPHTPANTDAPEHAIDSSDSKTGALKVMGGNHGHPHFEHPRPPEHRHAGLVFRQRRERATSQKPRRAFWQARNLWQELTGARIS